MMQGNKTYEEMLAFAREHFGDEATVSWDGEGWVINTKVQEKFDMEDYKGTPAYEASKSGPEYHSELDEWVEHSDHYYSSLRDQVVAYNQWIEETHFASAIKVLTIFRDAPEYFDIWDGGIGHRDYFLAYAEEKGITLENGIEYQAEPGRTSPAELVRLWKEKNG